MRVVGKLARECLDEGAKACGVGVTTDEIDRIVHEAAIDRDCYPSPLNYYKFPKACCTSVNEVICHGIPDTRPLENGNICNLDVTVYHRGFHGDLNESKQLIDLHFLLHLMIIEILKLSSLAMSRTSIKNLCKSLTKLYARQLTS